MMKKRDQDNFWFWLRQLRMRTIFLITIPCLILIPLIVLWLMPIVGINNSKDTIDSADTARRVLGLIDFDHLSGPEIKRRIEELLRIKDSVKLGVHKNFFFHTRELTGIQGVSELESSDIKKGTRSTCITILLLLCTR